MRRHVNGALAIVTIAAMTMLVPARADAQGGQRPLTDRGRAGGRNPQAPPPNASLAQIENYFDTYLVMQARQVLALQDDQFFSVAPRIERLQNLRRRLQRERQRVIQELATLLQKPGAMEDAEVAPKIKFLDEQLTTSSDELKKAYAEIDQVLTPRQRAQFRVFEFRMERQKLDLLAAARAQGRGGQNPPQPQPPSAAAAGAGS